MKMTIIGAGNIGTLMAAEFAEKGHCVTVYSSKPEKFNGELQVYDNSDNLLFVSKVHKVTDSLEVALKEAEIIWITVPAFLFDKTAKEMLPYVDCYKQMIGVVPGSGGAEFAFREFIKKGCLVFGLQRVHSIARLKDYGKEVYMLGKKDSLYVGSIPKSRTNEISQIVQQIFDIPCVALPNYLTVTLTPSNPILHTTRLYSLFRDYTPDTVYLDNIMFYENWDEYSSENLIACDEELQRLCDVIPLDLENVKSLKEHYESPTPEALTEKIRSIQAFKGLASPMKETPSGWTPDFNSRYFTADFSFGLKVIKEIARLFETPVPNIDKVWSWYERVSPDDAKKSFNLDISQCSFLKLY